MARRELYHGLDQGVTVTVHRPKMVFQTVLGVLALVTDGTGGPAQGLGPLPREDPELVTPPGVLLAPPILLLQMPLGLDRVLG